MMNVAITKGIKITVTTLFRSDLTQLDKSLYFYNYTIVIENLSNSHVQLKSRFWRIVDSLAPTRIIEGKGVVGEQPLLEPSELYTYTSGCDLSSAVGYMEGHYDFVIIDDAGNEGETFSVEVPRFSLEYKPKMN